MTDPVAAKSAVSASALPGYGYSRLFTTRWNDNDVFGHINNTIHYAAMDTTITSWLLDFATIDPAQAGAGGGEITVVVSSSCAYLASVSFPESLLIGLRAAKIGTSSVTWELGIHRASDHLLVATGQFVHVFVSGDTRRPVPIPAAVRAEIQSQLVMEPS